MNISYGLACSVKLAILTLELQSFFSCIQIITVFVSILGKKRNNDERETGVGVEKVRNRLRKSKKKKKGEITTK